MRSNQNCSLVCMQTHLTKQSVVLIDWIMFSSLALDSKLLQRRPQQSYEAIDATEGMCEPGSSGSIVSGYGLDDRAIGVRSPAGAKDFSYSLFVQTGSGVHPASGGHFPWVKARPGRDADHSPPSSAEVVNE
jgi:hypothetical protein